jgi:hypothetical protein
VGVDKHRPRREVISHPEFVVLREQAMEALGT